MWINKLTNASVIGLSEIKLENVVWNSELEIEWYSVPDDIDVNWCSLMIKKCLEICTYYEIKRWLP